MAPYFINTILMAVPAVLISTFIGALNGYVLTKWNFRGANVFFGMLLFGKSSYHFQHQLLLYR